MEQKHLHRSNIIRVNDETIKIRIIVFELNSLNLGLNNPQLCLQDVN